MERVRKKSNRPEDAIQREVFKHLKVRKAKRVFAFHVPNGGKRAPIEAAIMKGLGVTAGVPDLIAIKDGKTYGLELKAEGGRVGPKQNEVLWQMENAGAVTGIVFGLSAALKWLEDNGILVGRAS